MEKQTKGFQWICIDCGKVINSSSESQQAFNVGVHKMVCQKSAEQLVKKTPIGNLDRKLK